MRRLQQPACIEALSRTQGGKARDRGAFVDARASGGRRADAPDSGPGPRPDGRMLDDSDDPACHEPGCAHRGAAASQLAHFDLAAPGDDLDPPARAGGLDLIGLGDVTGVDDDLDPVAFHAISIPAPRLSYAVPLPADQ